MSIVAADAASGEIAPLALASAVDAAVSAPAAGHAVDLDGAEATARVLLALDADGARPPGMAGA